MKDKLTDEIRRTVGSGKEWLKKEIEYTKYTVAEKATILASAVAFGAVCLLLGMVALIMLGLCIERLFELFLSPVLSYLCCVVVVVIIILMVFLFRRSLIYNPISRFITRLFFTTKENEDK